MDSSFQSDVDDCKSNSGYVFTLNEATVSWKSSKQDTIVDSTIEAKYIATTEAAKEKVRMKKFIIDLGVVSDNEKSIPIYYDNNGAIPQAKELRPHHKCPEKVPPNQRDHNPWRCSSAKSSIRR